jgi:hypothetical protein
VGARGGTHEARSRVLAEPSSVEFRLAETGEEAWRKRGWATGRRAFWGPSFGPPPGPSMNDHSLTHETGFMGRGSPCTPKSSCTPTQCYALQNPQSARACIRITRKPVCSVHVLSSEDSTTNVNQRVFRQNERITRGGFGHRLCVGSGIVYEQPNERGQSAPDWPIIRVARALLTNSG